MEQAGFVIRARDADDERRVLITLTPHGRALRESAREVPMSLARQTGLKPEDVEDLRQRTQTLVAKLSSIAA
jgi:DNA-binding MarR family transcriptional regulator